MKTVSIVGAGRLGGALAYALPREKYTVEHLIVRSAKTSLPTELARSAVRGDEVSEIGSDIVFFTTADGEIETAAASLKGKLKKDAFVFHTSGSRSSSILDVLRPHGILGSIHPLVSISDPTLGPERFQGAYFCVEGDAAAVELGSAIVTDLGGDPFSIGTEFKTLYHASAVTACGHLVALFDAAVEMMSKTGLTPERSKQILLPLVSSTVRNLSEQSTAAALTGTFARADSDTFTKHIAALDRYGSDELLEIYLLLGERSLELAAKQGVSQERLETLRSRVAVAKSKLKW